MLDRFLGGLAAHKVEIVIIGIVLFVLVLIVVSVLNSLGRASDRAIRYDEDDRSR